LFDRSVPLNLGHDEPNAQLKTIFHLRPNEPGSKPPAGSRLRLLRDRPSTSNGVPHLGHSGAIVPLQEDLSTLALTGPTHRFRRVSNLGHNGVIVPLQANFSPSIMTGPTHRFKRASNLGHDGALVPFQADFSPSVMTGPTHRFKRASNLGHDRAIMLLQADFSTSG
jgi:hypothetical protein